MNIWRKWWFKAICIVIIVVIASLIIPYSLRVEVTGTNQFVSISLGKNEVSAASISYVGVGTLVRASSGNVTPTLPSGWAADDIFLCFVASRDNVEPTMSIDWTQVDNGRDNGTGLYTKFFWRRAVAGDVNPIVTHANGSYICAVIVAYRGVDTGSLTDIIRSPIDIIGSPMQNPAGSTLTFSNGTITNFDNDWIVEFGGVAGRATSSAYTGSPVPTERVDSPNATNYPEIVVADFIQATHGNTGSRASTLSSSSYVSNGRIIALKAGGGVGPLQATKTPVFITGAESGIAVVGSSTVTPLWSGIIGTPAINTDLTYVHYGLRSYRFNPTLNTRSLYKTLASKIVVGTVAIRFTTLPSSTSDLIYLSDTKGGLDIRFNSGTSKLEAIVGAGSAVASIDAITTDTWYVVDFDGNTSAATATLDWKINGTAQTQATNAQTSANMTRFTIGMGNGNTVDMYADDIVLSYTTADYPFGTCQVLGYSPNVDGTHSFNAGDFKYNDTTNILVSATDVNTYIDEVPITSTSDFISGDVINANGYVEIGFADTAQTSDAWGLEVEGSFHSTTDTNTDTCTLKFNDGGTIQAEFTDLDVSYAAILYAAKCQATAPSGGAWTQAKINALLARWGYVGDITPVPYVDGLILEIAFPVGGATYTLTNAPPSKAFGTIPQSATYYAKGTAPVDPTNVADTDCIFTITNNGSSTEKITITGANFTGGVGAALTSDAPGSDQVRVAAYCKGDDISSPPYGVVLTTSPQTLHASLIASATIMWDFRMELGTCSESPPVAKQGLITLSAVAP